MIAANTRLTVNGAGSLDDDRTQRRRKEITLGACAVFDERGYANTRIADISAHLKIGQGTIYRYFTGKDDLMDHIIAHGVRRILSAMRENSALTEIPSSGTQFTEQITTVTHRLLEMVDTEPALVRVLLLQAPAARPEAIAHLTERLSAATTDYLDRGIANGYLRPDLNTAVVADAMSGIGLFAMRRSLRSRLCASDRAAISQSIGQLIAHGTLEPEQS